jgi:hypothetical protein
MEIVLCIIIENKLLMMMTFCICADEFYIFCILIVKAKYFLISCLLLWKHLLIIEILQEAASEF